MVLDGRAHARDALMMRKLFLLGPVLATAVVFAACEDSSSSAPEIGNPEGGSFEGGGPSEGGSPVDSSTDAADAAAAKSVTVTVVRGAAPAANVNVVFHDAAGAVLETKATGPDGKATSSAGVTPVMASALLGAGNRRRIITWTAVEIGDELFANDIGAFGSSGTYEVALQGTFSDGGATAATASIGTCAGDAAGVAVTIDLEPECVRATNAVLARATSGASNETLRAYAFVKGKAPPPADAGAASTAIGPWLLATEAIVTPKNKGAVGSGSLELGFYQIADTLPFPSEFGAFPDRITGAIAYKVAPGFADAYQAAFRIRQLSAPGAPTGATLTVGKRYAPAAAVDIDLATVLPALNAVFLDEADKKRPKVSWTTAAGASLAATDGGSVAIEWQDNRTQNRGWTFVVAPGSSSVAAPAMPALAAEWVPALASDAGAASNLSRPEVTFVESDLLASYAAFRRDIGRIIPLRYGRQRDATAVLPANGTIRTTSFQTVVN